MPVPAQAVVTHPVADQSIASLSADGALLCVAAPRQIMIHDLRVERVATVALPAVSAAVVGEQVWALTVGAVVELHRFGRSGAPVAPPLALPVGGSESLALTPARIGAAAAVVQGAAPLLLASGGDTIAINALDGVDGMVIPLGAQAWIERHGGRLWQRRRGIAARPLEVPAEMMQGAQVVGGAALLGGALSAIELRGDVVGHALAVVDLRRGAMVGRLRLDGVRRVVLVESRGHAVLVRGPRAITVVDLATMRCIAECGFESDVVDLAVDARGGRAALVRRRVDGELVVDVMEYETFVAPAKPPAVAEPEAAVEAAAEPVVEAEAAVEPAAAAAAEPEAELLDVPWLVGLRARPMAPRLDDDELREYLSDAFGLVASWCRRALALACDRGRLNSTGCSTTPIEQVRAILDGDGGRSSERIVATRAGEAEAWKRFWRWNRRGTPHIELAIELGLSPLASTILLVVAAPRIWGELARVYALIADDSTRPLIDELLLVHLLDLDGLSRRSVAAELDDDAPLRRHRLITLGNGPRPFVDLVPSQALVERLAGAAADAATEVGGVVARRADRSFEQLRVPRTALASVLRSLSEPAAAPVRLVVRGRAGAGRRTVAATLADEAERMLGLVEVSAAPPEVMASRLRDGLHQASHRGWLPCVSGVDHLDEASRPAITAVLDAYPGPLVVRTGPEVAPPLSPGYLALDLPALAVGERLAVWTEALQRRGLPASIVAMASELAARAAIGPGVIEQIAGAVAAAAPRDRATATAVAITALRQRRSQRMGEIATRVTHLPTWSDLVLPDDIIESLRELVTRIRHRHTVLETWGLERVASAARGVVALFQGGPGTGKTMVAGVLARELGFELYRVDLSRVQSKWIGETEKNLGAALDAAEEGEALLLFDEADALFSRRTEVKTSNDRFANAEVNYLLQRLDCFTGVALLTTNHGISIDPAFRRRLALRLSFPFPDEEQRRALWRAHVPPGIPVSGDLDLDELAARYQMSGGYVRNAVVRAACVAAGEGGPLTAAHLLTAVRLEYRDAGKVCEGGILE